MTTPHETLELELVPGVESIEAAISRWPFLGEAFPPRALRFLRGFRTLLARAVRIAPDPEIAAPAFALADALPALDEIAFALRRSLKQGEVRPGLESARRALASAIEGSGVVLLPRLVEPSREVASLEGEARAAGVNPSRAIHVEVVPSFAREGAIVALERRGIVESGLLAAPALVHVSSGEAKSARVALLEAALVALEAAKPSRDDLSRLVRELDRCERDDHHANGEAALRFAVSALERSGALPVARKAVVSFLEARGIVAVTLEPGEPFDPERHPPSLYERKRAKGAGAPGTVVGTELTGFRDEAGVVLGRAVVVVAE